MRALRRVILRRHGKVTMSLEAQKLVRLSLALLASKILP